MFYCMGCMEQYTDNVTVCPHCRYARGTPAREAYHMPPESILRKRYVVGRVLGYGGFGVTYIGYDAQLERKVAIKEYLPSALATRMPGNTQITVYGGESTLQFNEGLNKFVDEAQRLAKFNGLPGIVNIYDSFSENGTAYIVMEYLQGSDVKGLLNANGPMPYKQALPIILSVAETLEQVHALGIIHRDIAPDNILITHSGEVKLLDFGAARYESAANSKSLSVILKSGYAPEEQYRSHGEQGPWTDVYALAATFYKMLTGTTPEDSMERSVKDDLKEPSKLGADLPLAAENALMNALNIRTADRTQTMSEFATSLGREEVTRTKVKPRKQQSGSFPLWLKITLGGAIAAALMFAIITTNTNPAGTPKNELAVLPEGMVNAPGLLNRQENEAAEVVKEIGLLYSIAGKDINEKVEAGKVFKQEPVPGVLIETGGTMRLWVSGGSEIPLGVVEILTEDGSIDPSKIPDFSAYTYAQAVNILAGMDISTYALAEYHDVMEPGLVISYRFEEEEQRVCLILSAGEKPGPSDENAAEPIPLGFVPSFTGEGYVAGTMAFINPGDSRVQGVQVGTANINDLGSEHIPGTPLVQQYEMSGLAMSVLAASPQAQWLNRDEDYIGEIFERIRLHNVDAHGNRIGRAISAMYMNLYFPMNISPPEITGMDLLQDPEPVISFSGSFKKGGYYALRLTWEHRTDFIEILCTEDGSLVVAASIEDDALPVLVEVMECLSFTAEDGGSGAAASFSLSGVYVPHHTDNADNTILETVGLTYLDATAVLKQATGMTINYEAVFSEDVSVGTVAAQTYEPVNNTLTVIFSAGPEPASEDAAAPIILGITIEPLDADSPTEVAKLRFISPKAYRRQYTLYFKPMAGGLTPMGDAMTTISSAMSNSTRLLVHEIPLHNTLSRLIPFRGFNYDRDKDNKNLVLTDETMRLGLGIREQIEVYSDIPLRITLSRGSFLQSIHYIETETVHSDEDSYGDEYRHIFKIKGDFVQNELLWTEWGHDYEQNEDGSIKKVAYFRIYPDGEVSGYTRIYTVIRLDRAFIDTDGTATMHFLFDVIEAEAVN